jgi:hypothetical protein
MRNLFSVPADDDTAPFIKMPRHTAPPIPFHIDHCAPSLTALCDWLIQYGLWLRNNDSDPNAPPQISTEPQPGQAPVRFTAEITLPAQDLIDALVGIYNAIAIELQSHPGQPHIPSLTKNNGHWGKWTVAPEIIRTRKNTRNFRWSETVRVPDKATLIKELRQIASDIRTHGDNPPATMPPYRLAERLPNQGPLIFTAEIQSAGTKALGERLEQIAQRIQDGADRAEISYYGNWTLNQATDTQP